MSATMQQQLAAARYVFHKVTAHRYAVAVMRDGMSLDMARAHYDEAMRNYDGILRESGKTEAGNALEVEKGADAVNETVELMEAMRAARNG